MLISIWVTLFFLAFLTITFHFLIREGKVENKEINFYKEKGNFFKRYLKDSWYEKIDDYLKKSGYFISTEVYIFIHSAVLILIIYGIFTIWLEEGFAVFFSSAFRIIILCIIPINIFVRSKIKQRTNEIKLELCNIQDFMYFQRKIGTEEDKILVGAARISKGILREPLQDIANAPKVKKKMEEALARLRDISNIIELQSFSFILEQNQYTGASEENHKAQANMLKRNKRMRRRILRQYKRSKLTLAALLLFGCYTLLIVVPLMQEMIRNIDLMFR